MDKLKQPPASSVNESQIPESVRVHPAWLRLENQRKWYAAKSTSCKNWYRGLRIAQVACAVMIPVFNLFDPDIAKWLTTLSGAAIALLAGIEQINQYSALWATYRSAAERLKHEKFLFLSAAGPYRDQSEPDRLILLAQRIEEQISTEHAKWINVASRVVPQEIQYISPKSESASPEVAPNNRVEFAIFAPQKINKGKMFLLEVWAYYQSEYNIVLEKTKKSGLDRNLSVKDGIAIELNSVLQIIIEIGNLRISDNSEEIIWNGFATNAQFVINIPSNTKLGDYSGSATISCSGMILAKIKFIISIEESRVENIIDITEERFYPSTAFASYASIDRKQVMERVQGMKKVCPELDIFIDVISLRSGDNWQKKLEEHVPTKDIFYLFWSAPAAKSLWVEREWKLALAKRGIGYINPVPLIDVRDVPPPDELKALHFTDPILAHIAYENSRSTDL